MVDMLLPATAMDMFKVETGMSDETRGFMEPLNEVEEAIE